MPQGVRLLVVVAVLTTIPLCSIPHHASPSPVQSYRPGEVLVKVSAGLALTEQAHAVAAPPVPERRGILQAYVLSLNLLLNDLGASHAELLAADDGNTYRLRFPTSTDVAFLAQRLAAHPSVVFAEPNYVRHALLAPNDPTIQEQWALGTIGAFDAWNITTGSGIIIAVVDTGVSSTHPDLAGNVLPGYNAISNSNQTEDDNGHGTAIAGLIAASTNNASGIAGMCWGCRILPVKVLDAYGMGEDADLSRGIRWAADHGARIINLSMGGAENSPVLHDAINYAFQQGSLIVAAAGNDRMDGNFINYPAAIPTLSLLAQPIYMIQSPAFQQLVTI